MYRKKEVKKKEFDKRGIRTPAWVTISECIPLRGQANEMLESDALDRSAILPYNNKTKPRYFCI